MTEFVVRTIGIDSWFKSRNRLDLVGDLIYLWCSRQSCCIAVIADSEWFAGLVDLWSSISNRSDSDEMSSRVQFGLAVCVQVLP